MAKKKYQNTDDNWHGWDNVKLEDLLPVKMANVRKRQIATGDFVDSMISRASTDSTNYYGKILASNFQWDESLGEDEVTSSSEYNQKILTASDLRGMGFQIVAREANLEAVEAKEVLLRQKTKGKPSHIVQAGTSEQPVFELWYQPNPAAYIGKVADWSDKKMVKVATKRQKYVIASDITKIAWDQVERYGLLDGMEHVGFNVYQSSEPGGIWWKEKVEDPETGDIKYFLVKKKGTDKAKDVGGNKVVSVSKAASAETEMVKVAQKVLIRKAVDQEITKEDATDTQATKSSGVKAKTIDVTGSGWKKEVEDYLKECKDNGFKVEKMEVKVVDWKAKDNSSDE